MGITGLLPFLKSIQREVHLSSFKGKRAAVDAYCWLHKGAYSCSMQLVMGTDQLETLPFIKYCMKKVNLLRQNGLTPIMVFDGGHLPTKAHTETERRERRKEYLAKGKQLLKEGKRSEAVDCFQKSVDVSPEMALALIKECRKIGVECVVAPYEADAQLAYLVKEGLADLVITEDSDLLVFGCERVLFKLDDSGRGKLVELSDLGKANKGLVGFTQDSFRQMCIFSGCDYLPSVPGIGLGKALKLMRRCNQNSSRVIKALQTETGKVPQGYEESFRKAEETFLYQLVFDPRTQREVRLHPLPEHMDPSDVTFAGVEHSPKKAVNMARGNINPISQQVLDSYSPSKAPPRKTSSWTESVMSGGGALPIQAKLSLSASQKSREPFRAPKRKHDSVDEPDLCSLYGENAESADSQSPTQNAVDSQMDTFIDTQSSTETRSKFFSASPTEATPCEQMAEPTHPVRRALTDKQLSQHSPQSVRKQLFTTDSTATRESVLMMRSKYQYSSKRQKTNSVDAKHHFELLEEKPSQSIQSEDLSSSPSRNPFLVSKPSPKQSPSFTVTQSAVEPSHPVTSSSFLTPHPSLQQKTTPSSRGGWLSRKGLSTAQQPAKKVGRVGLSKSISGSKFKAPRLMDTQTTLSGFCYTRRPQLKH